MNYQKIYDLLIERAIQRVVPDSYFEEHHVIPRCLGGSDDNSNLVKLTAREHFLVHWLLHRIYPEDKGLASAFFFMSHCLNGSRDYRVSARAYGEARDAHSKAISISLKGIQRSEETKRKLSARVITDEWRRKVGLKSKGRSKGKTISDDQKRAISMAQKLRWSLWRSKRSKHEATV